MTNKKLLVQVMLSHDLDFACKYLQVLYEHQTLDEKQVEQTQHNNQVGFTIADAPVLSGIAEAIRSQTALSAVDKKEVLARMPKYTGQLLHLVRDDELY